VATLLASSSRSGQESVEVALVAVAYVATVGGTVVLVDTRTGEAGRPIRVQADVVVATPDGRTVYALSGYGRLRPVRTPAGTVGKYIKVSAAGPGNVMITPDGKTAYGPPQKPQPSADWERPGQCVWPYERAARIDQFRALAAGHFASGRQPGSCLTRSVSPAGRHG
jgi:hypothetical protein